MKKVFLVLISLFCLKNLSLDSKTYDRLISLAPNVTETLFSIGAGNLLIANTHECDFPKKAVSLSKIGSYLYPNIEKILSLRPSLVIASQDNNQDSLLTLKETKTELFILKIKSLDAYLASVVKLGEKIHRQNEAKLLVRKLKNNFKKKKAYKKTFSFIFFISLDSLHTISKLSFINDIFDVSGFKNVIQNTKLSYPMLQREALLDLNPDFVFVTQLPKKSLKQSYKLALNSLKPFFDLKNKVKLVILKKDIFLRLGPRISEAKDFLESLYKESMQKREEHL